MTFTSVNNRIPFDDDDDNDDGVIARLMSKITKVFMIENNRFEFANNNRYIIIK